MQWHVQARMRVQIGPDGLSHAGLGSRMLSWGASWLSACLAVAHRRPRRKSVNATPRQLESLIRLSEALARMRLDEEVRVEDVTEAMRLMKQALSTSAIDPTTGDFSMDILNTGVADSARHMAKHLPAELQRIIDEAPGASGSVSALLAAIKEGTSNNVTHQQVVAALTELPTVTVTGGSWSVRRP